MSDKLREALKRIVGIRGICFEGRPLCHAIDQFDLIHNLAVKALADTDPEHTHECKYCPDEDGHPDGFCICKHCGVRLGLSPAREAKRRETLKRIDGMLYVQGADQQKGEG